MFSRRVRDRRRALAASLHKVTEEITFRREYDRRVRAVQSVLIRTHRTIEGKEIGILSVGVGENLRFFCLTLATQNLRLAARFCNENGHFPVGARLDALGNLLAFSPELV